MTDHWKMGTGVLGVLGGMGPMATQLFYRKIIDMTQAEIDQDHVNMILLNHASMPDRTNAILSGRIEELFIQLCRDVHFLEESGASVIAIPCNTSHVLVDRLQQESGIPILHMIRETAREICQGSEAVSKVGVLATQGTISSGQYQEALKDVGIEAYLPSEATQIRVTRIIYEGIKAGREIERNDLVAIEEELVDKGCQSAILACTELSCLKEEHHLSRFYIDAMDVLAMRAITSCGKQVKGNEGK